MTCARSHVTTSGLALVAVLVAGGSSAQEAAPQAAAPEQRFLIEAYDVAGNTLLAQAEIERAVYPFLGPDRVLADVDKARQALEAAYRRLGYEAVYVANATPPDATTVVTFQVTEAKVGTLAVTGARYSSARAIAQAVPSLAEGGVPNLAQAQRELAALDRGAPDRRITPRIVTGAVPGTIDVTLEVEDSLPYHAALTLTNDHSPNTKPLRLLANARATNLWQAGHTLSVTYLVAPERKRDAEVYAGSYLAPIAGSQWSLLVFGYKSNSDVALLGGANVLGDGYAVGARAILALPQAGAWSHSVNFGADYKDFEETTFAAGDVIPAPVRYVPLAAAYSAQRIGDTTTLNASLGLTAGVRAFNDTISPGLDPVTGEPLPPEAIFGNRRTGARENFVHANFDADYTATFPSDAQFVTRVAAQYSNGPLIANEQFSAGGLASVRGYFQSEAVGDDGVSGTLEFRAPSLGSAIGAFVEELRLYAFVDGGFVRSRQPLPEEVFETSLVSVGAGLRLAAFDFLSGDAVLGLPLSNGGDTGDDFNTRIGDATFHFSVKGEF